MTQTRNPCSQELHRWYCLWISRAAYGQRAQGATVQKYTAATKAGFIACLGYLVDEGSTKL